MIIPPFQPRTRKRTVKRFIQIYERIAVRVWRRVEGPMERIRSTSADPDDLPEMKIFAGRERV